jgi:(heptosyl)LPS beta-1,4-glucosyltransferase
MPKVTVLITCKDEELHIRDCIESARTVADEILVADSGSTDSTLQIVSELGGCRVIEREFISYADFKNWALPQCQHEWVLILDADERVTPELAAEVKQLLNGDPEQDAYWVRRDNYFLGHRIRYCGWSTSKVVRLVRRDACRYFPRPVHEAMNVPSGKTAVLRSRMSHYTAWDIEQFVAKQNNYSSRGAVHLHAQGRRVNLAITLLHAPVRFLQLYLLRGGFLDGYAGLMVCGIMSFYTFLKDIKVWGIDHIKDPPAGLKRPEPAAIVLRQAA